MKSLFLSFFAAALLVACSGGKQSTTETTTEPIDSVEVVAVDTAAVAPDSLAVTSEADSTLEN